MDLVEDEYLDSSKFTEKDLAERGGPVIPDEAAAIVKNVQAMQDLTEPYKIPIMKLETNQIIAIKQISAGANHVLAVSQDGRCFGWGDNEYGQLGLGRILAEDENLVPEPTLLKELTEKKILMAAAGGQHSLFLTELG